MLGLRTSILKVLFFAGILCLGCTACFAPIQDDYTYTRFRIPSDAPLNLPVWMKLGRHDVCVSTNSVPPGDHCHVYPVSKAGDKDARLKHREVHRAHRPIYWFIFARGANKAITCEATCMSRY